MIKLEIGKNDLLSCNPELAKEYYIEKNIEPIENIFVNCRQKVWWKCHICGYNWEQSVNSRNYLKIDGTFRSNRHKHMSSCPKCSKFYKTSFPEQAIFFYIKKYFKDATNSYKNEKILKNYELDIYIPSLNIAIEYDGYAWHKDVSRDLNKSILCKKNNIKLIRVREKMCPKIKDNSIKIVINKNTTSNLEKAIKKILLILNINNAVINIDKDTQSIQKQYKKQKIKRSIVSNKKLLKEFSPNNLIPPENIALNSAYKYLWICPKGHEYEMSPNHRNNMRRNCPYCANRRILIGYNDLMTINPKLAKEWNYKKNGDLKPTQVTYGSDKKVWWICSKCNYEWQAVIHTRRDGVGCPKCCNIKKYRKVVQYDKNGNLIRIFNSIKETSELCKIPEYSIGHCCAGRTKTCQGYVFRYAEEG